MRIITVKSKPTYGSTTPSTASFSCSCDYERSTLHNRAGVGRVRFEKGPKTVNAVSIFPTSYLQISNPFIRMLLAQWIAVAILYIHKMAQNVKCLDTQMRVPSVSLLPVKRIYSGL